MLRAQRNHSHDAIAVAPEALYLRTLHPLLVRRYGDGTAKTFGPTVLASALEGMLCLLTSTIPEHAKCAICLLAIAGWKLSPLHRIRGTTQAPDHLSMLHAAKCRV